MYLVRAQTKLVRPLVRRVAILPRQSRHNCFVKLSCIRTTKRTTFWSICDNSMSGNYSTDRIHGGDKKWDTVFFCISSCGHILNSLTRNYINLADTIWYHTLHRYDIPRKKYTWHQIPRNNLRIRPKTKFGFIKLCFQVSRLTGMHALRKTVSPQITRVINATINGIELSFWIIFRSSSSMRSTTKKPVCFRLKKLNFLFGALCYVLASVVWRFIHNNSHFRKWSSVMAYTGNRSSLWVLSFLELSPLSSWNFPYMIYLVLQ